MDPFPGKYYDYNTRIDLGEHSKYQTVLLARTRDDSHLRVPIDFAGLREDGLCLPVSRTDVPITDDDVVRVSLADAVKFITDLQQKEESTFAQPIAISETGREAKVWADEQLNEADEKGIENVICAQGAVRRIKAARNGEMSAEWEPEPFNKIWK